MECQVCWRRYDARWDAWSNGYGRNASYGCPRRRYDGYARNARTDGWNAGTDGQYARMPGPMGGPMDMGGMPGPMGGMPGMPGPMGGMPGMPGPMAGMPGPMGGILNAGKMGGPMDMGGMPGMQGPMGGPMDMGIITRNARTDGWNARRTKCFGAPPNDMPFPDPLPGENNPCQVKIHHQE